MRALVHTVRFAGYLHQVCSPALKHVAKAAPADAVLPVFPPSIPPSFPLFHPSFIASSPGFCLPSLFTSHCHKCTHTCMHAHFTYLHMRSHTHTIMHIRMQEDEDWLVRAPLLSMWDDKFPTMPAAVGDDGYDGFGDCSGFDAWGIQHPHQPFIMGPVCYLPARDQVSVWACACSLRANRSVSGAFHAAHTHSGQWWCSVCFRHVAISVRGALHAACAR